MRVPHFKLHHYPDLIKSDPFRLQILFEIQDFKKISLDEPSFGYILAAIIYPRLSIESGTN